jgi:WD40 repeat protein
MKSLSKKLLIIVACLLITLSFPSVIDAQDMGSATPYSVDWSGDGTKLAVGYSNGVVDILDTETREPIQSVSIANLSLIMVAWNPVNSAELAVSGVSFMFGNISVFNTTTGEKITDIDIPNGGAGHIAWKPDGSLLAAAVQRGNHPAANYLIDTFDPLTGEYLASYSSDPGDLPISMTEWSPDGTKMATTFSQEEITVWQPRNVLSTSMPPVTLQGHSDNILAMAWNSSGTQLASGGFDGTLRIWDANSGENVNTFEYGSIKEIEWRPNSDQIALTSRNKVLIVDSVTGAILTTFEISGNLYLSNVRGITWNPDGSQLAYVGGNETTYDFIEIISAPENIVSATPTNDE